MMTYDQAQRVEELIQRAVRWTLHDFPNIEREDLSQELWIFVLENTSVDPDHPGLHSLLTRKAKAIAWEIRKEHLHQTAQYSYRTSDVREILETVFDRADWLNSFCPDDAKSEDRMGAIEVRADIFWAWEHLPEQYQAALVSRYKDRVEPPANTSERRQLNRAIRRLVDILNSYYRSSSTQGGPGSRRAINNATAQYILERQIDE